VKLGERIQRIARDRIRLFVAKQACQGVSTSVFRLPCRKGARAGVGDQQAASTHLRLRRFHFPGVW
jgi:hypothetical protein